MDICNIHQSNILLCTRDIFRHRTASVVGSLHLRALHVHQGTGDVLLLWSTESPHLQRRVPQRTSRLPQHSWLQASTGNMTVKTHNWTKTSDLVTGNHDIDLCLFMPHSNQANVAFVSR